MTKRIVLTGADGFIGRNLCLRLQERGHADVVSITRTSSASELHDALVSADVVFHLAGVNRPRNIEEFAAGNASLTQQIADILLGAGRRAMVVFASSTQAALDNPYGHSKLAAEQALFQYGAASGASVQVFRLTNVFGKWARPNYNSAVATFCHNVVHGLELTIHNPDAPLRLVYVDDVCAAMLALLDGDAPAAGFAEAGPVYETTVGAVADTIRAFPDSRGTMLTDRVGTGLVRALYSTYLSYLPPSAFSYQVRRHVDPRGAFVEMLKTPDCGQFSYFTAHPGVTRGEHYHHTKTEKFLVIKGEANFGFRHVVTGERYDMNVRGGDAHIVETVPGWTHNITNIGDDELIVMLWANEIFDPARPDTVSMKVGGA